MADASNLFRDLAHATISHWKKKPTDNITQHNALFRWMKENNGIKSDIDGGLDITEPVVLMENPTIQNYSGYQALNTGAAEVTQIAKFPWCQKAMHVSASGFELRVNKGKAMMYRLVDTKLEAANTTAANRMAIEIYSDGSIADGLQGLEVFITNDGTGTIGGIDSSLYSNWKNQFYSPGAAASYLANDKVRGHFNTLYIDCTVGNEMPDLIVASNDVYTALEEAMQLQMRYPYPYQSEKEANFGFQGLQYKKATVVHDANVSFATNAHRAYFLNTKYIYLYEHPDAKWDEEEARKPVNQDATVIPFYWQGGTAIKNRRLQGKLFYS